MPPSNDKLLTTLVELRAIVPEWRFGQLVANLALTAGRDGELCEFEDEELLAAARRLIERNRTREQVQS
jgi:hypothetical protein